MLTIKNTKTTYGLIAVLLHWITAVGVIGLFSLGLWMDGLGYQHPWYQTAPHWHKSIGVLLIALVLVRLIWRLTNVRPQAIATHKKWERVVAHAVHLLFYALLFAMFATGYLITTAKGKSLEVFDWFSLPSVVSGIDNLEDLAGEIHEVLAFSIIGLATLHALAALKHHWVDRDKTLLRMFGRGTELN